MSDTGRIEYSPTYDYGTGMGKPCKVVVRPTPDNVWIDAQELDTLRARIATLERQVEQARGLIDSAMEMMGEGCSICNACSVGGPYDPHCPYGVWLEARFNFLQALREGEKNA